jgi:DNA-binding protein HU-beta
MNKAQLVEQLASQMDLTKADCERVIDSTIETIKKAVKKGEDVTLVGFGTFTKAKRKARMGRNPQTGEAMEISARKVLTFTPSRILRDGINGKSAALPSSIVEGSKDDNDDERDPERD